MRPCGTCWLRAATPEMLARFWTRTPSSMLQTVCKKVFTQDLSAAFGDDNAYRTA